MRSLLVAGSVIWHSSWFLFFFSFFCCPSCPLFGGQLSSPSRYVFIVAVPLAPFYLAALDLKFQTPEATQDPGWPKTMASIALFSGQYWLSGLMGPGHSLDEG